MAASLPGTPSSIRISCNPTHRLNPHADTFTPSWVLPTNDPPIEVRISLGKGFGLFATRAIPVGTLIISESPLISIAHNDINLAWEQYRKLGPAEKANFDALHFCERKGTDLGQASRSNLLAQNTRIWSENEEKVVLEHVRITSIFSANSITTAGSRLAVFVRLSRLNHSCIPNVHHSNNSATNVESLHAIRDILPGEELLINYLDSEATYMTRTQRWELLRESYGFTCQCNACTDHTGQSDLAREMLGFLAFGLVQYHADIPPESDYCIPKSPKNALLQAEDIISLLIQEGQLSLELMKAYRYASRGALALANFDRAVEYAYDEAEVESNVLGANVDKLKEQGKDSGSWLVLVAQTMRSAGARLENFDRNIQRKLERSLPETRARKNLKKREKEAANFEQ